MIIAAGASSRTGGNKLFYKWNSTTVIESVIQSMEQFCSEILVVTGSRDEIIKETLVNYKSVTLIHNPQWQNGMTSSITAGLKELKGKNIIYCPGDYPGISGSSYKTVIETGTENSRLCLPEYKGTPGPPVYLPSDCLETINLLSENITFRQWMLKQNPILIPCNDPFILADIDTDAEYEKHLKLCKQ